MREVTISDDMIRLGQFLKLADVIEAGSDVKYLLGSERVTVNGEPENRRGRQLFRGDIVTVGDDISLVVA
ncbi:RNA-binding S4 domain-containing protein [Catenuloplanes japonicus]|uniref:RNA-binding S4 domain-containing protein n=1 Tax=Catenuloplanes japonicus TaxID=33876 RepID=UPI000527201F|nr:RNA-binding S4 domain-containing protein [Catenuloplanes japonicus]